MAKPKSQLETLQILDPPAPEWRAEVFDGHAHGVARRNQRLPHTWTALSPIDIDDLVAALERTIAKDVGSKELELALTIAAILTTGRSLRSVFDLVLDPTGQLLDDDTEGLIRFGSGWVWSFKSHGTQLDRKEELRTQSRTEPFVSCERRLLLQSPSLVQRIANQLSEKRKSVSEHRVQPIVGLTSGGKPDTKKVRAELDSWLRSARWEGPRRKLSAAHLRHWLITEIARVAGADLGAARAISGAKLEVEVAGTYGVYPVDHLRRIYREVIRPFDKKLVPLLELPIGYVGRSRTPERQTISKLAADLQKPLRPTRGKRSIVNLHNAMVRYTAAFLMIATAVRPTKKLVIKIDLVRGYAVVYDKAVHELRARLIWLPSALMEQIKLYREHLTALYRELSTDARGAIETMHSVDRDAALPLFELNGDGLPIERHISKIWLDTISHFAPERLGNINRHFLHGELVGRCAPETLQAIFGHWNVGTEPWSKSSAFDPLLYKADALRGISETLEDLGWVPIPALRPKARSASQHHIQRASFVGNVSAEDNTWGSPGRRTHSPFNSHILGFLPPPLEDFPIPEVKAARKLKTREERLGTLLASAIRNGLLLDRNWWAPWLNALRDASNSGDISCLEMEAPDPEDPQHIYCYPRRWFCDEVTSILIDRWISTHAAEDLKGGLPSPEACLEIFLGADEANSSSDRLELFLEAAEFEWRLKVPGIVLDYAAGRGPSISVDRWSWSRLKGFRLTTTRPGKTESAEAGSSSDADILPKRSLPPEITAHIEKWEQMAKESQRTSKRRWGQKRAYAARTLSSYRSAVETAFGVCRHLSNDWCEPDVLDEIYFSYIFALSASARNNAIHGISLFQQYLIAEGVTEDTGTTYWHLKQEGRVSNNLVSSSDFERALRLLSGPDRITQMRRLILILGFRAGLRANELLGLEFGDVSKSSQPHRSYFEIRLKHHLKTPQSRRVLPLDVLLSQSEQDELEAWISEECQRPRRQKGNLLFSNLGGGRGLLLWRDVIGPIETALRTASGDPDLTFSHLRHSFVSYLTATLLLPREGTKMQSPGAVDKTCISERRRRRILRRTIGSERIGTSSLHVVSEMCGHRPTSTTLRWYCHLLDWVAGAYATRSYNEPLLPLSAAHELAGILPQSAAGADYRLRARARADETQAPTTARYKLPPLENEHDFQDGLVRLSSIRKSIARHNQRLRSLRPAGSKGILPQHFSFHPPIKLSKSANDVGAAPIGWPAVREAVLRLRRGEEVTTAAEGVAVAPVDVDRWGRVAAQLIEPRRESDKRPPFLHKMNRIRWSGFDLQQWKDDFPHPPRGAGLDVADQIWEFAVPRLDKPRAREALHYFCQHYSVDTGVTTFSKKWEAEHFYRGFAELGFLNAMYVGVYQSRCNRDTGGRGRGFEVDWNMQAALNDTLPKYLKDTLPKKRRRKYSPGWPRFSAIQLNRPKHVQLKNAKSGETRKPVLFAVLMLAIYALDRVREPPRRYPWKPGYGGYSPREAYPGSGR